MSKEGLKSELWNRIVKSWASTLLGLALVVTLLIMAGNEKIEWESAYGWIVFGAGLVTKKDNFLKIP